MSSPRKSSTERHPRQDAARASSATTPTTVHPPAHTNPEALPPCVAQAPIGFAFVSADGRCLAPNRAFCRIVGAEPDASLNLPLANLFPDGPFTAPADLPRLTAGATWVDARVRSATGAAVAVSLFLAICEPCPGGPAPYCLYVSDAGDRRELEERLRESEQRLDMALERADLGLWDENVVTGVVNYSDRYLRMLGYTPADFEATEAAWRDTIHPDDKERVLTTFRDCVLGRTGTYQTEYRLRTKGGEYRHVLSSGRVFERDANGNVVRVLGTHLDVTEYKRIQERLQAAQHDLEQRVEERTAALMVANEQLKQEICQRTRIEAALRESEQRFRDLFENAPVCVVEVDFGQTPAVIVQANQQTSFISGWGMADLISRPVSRLIPSHRTLTQIAQARCGDTGSRAGDTIRLDAFGRRCDGTRFPIRVYAAVASDRNDERTILTVEDVSAEVERRSEQEAIAEERRRIAREIHDGLAQDLAWLRLKARLWQDLIFSDPERMATELGGLRQILDKNIRDVRRSIFSLRPLDLDKLGFFNALRQFASDFADQNQLTIDLNISGPENTLPSNLELVLFRIIQEALNNVGKHAHASDVELDLNMAAADFVIFLRVRDNGVGFSPTATDPEETVRHGHLGIKHIRERVERLGGTFFLHSETGRGTEMQITLPTTNPRGYSVWKP